MILEAFAKYLHAADPTIPAGTILARWLWERLTKPPETLTDRVLRSEIEASLKVRKGRYESLPPGTLVSVPSYNFAGKSDSGRRLLKSLYEYALSYEQQKWSRWVHKVKATDFNRRYNSEDQSA